MENNMNGRISLTDALKTAGILLLVFAVVATGLFLINELTEKKISENESEVKRNAILSLFGTEEIDYTELDLLEGDGEAVRSVYRVSLEDQILGYCVSVVGAGFGGDVEMMVAMTTERTVIGVKILSMSETHGIGTRINDENYLAQYTGKGEAISSGDVDLIAGATRSSMAVLEGVNAATSALANHMGGGLN